MSGGRVLHLFNAIGFPTESVWLDYAERLASRTWDIELAAERLATGFDSATLSWARASVQVLERVEVDSTVEHAAEAEMVALAHRDPPAATRRLLDRSFRVIHGHGGTRVLLAAPWIARGVATVVSLYGYDASRLLRDRAWAARYRWAASHGAHFVALCATMRDSVLAATDMPPDAIDVIPLGIDPARWPYAPSPTPSPPRFVFIGRLTEKKRPLDLIEAFERARDHLPPATLDVYGDGPLRDDARRLIDERGIAHRVALHGPIARDEVPARLAGATALVLPSATASDGDREGTPIVLMEAQALGVPCVTTSHSGNPELLPPTADRFVVPERDVPALSNAMIALASLQTSERRRLTDAGRRWIETRFDIERTVSAYDALYERLPRIS